MRIGLQVPGIRDYFSLSIWRYANELLQETDHQLFIFPVDSPNPKHSSIYRMSLYNFINSSNLDGMILSGSSFLNTLKKDQWENFLEPFIHDVPTVSIGKTFDGIPMVCTSAFHGINQAVDHLVNKHNITKIAFQKGCEGNPEASERFECYKEALERVGLTVEEQWIFPGEFIERSGFELADNLMEKYETLPFEAILVSNDTMAGALMDRLVQHNIRIPEDLKVIGFDDIPLARYFTRPLATIKQPFRKQVSLAIEKLLSLVNDKGVSETTLLETEFIPRTSCGCIRDSYSSMEEFFRIDHNVHLSESLIEQDDYRKLRQILLETPHSPENMDLFLSTLEQIIAQSSREEHFFYWSRKMALLSKECREQSIEGFKFYENRGMFQIAQFLLGDKILFEKSREINHFKVSTTEPLLRLSGDLNSVHTKDEIFRTLENHLIKLGFKYASVFLFEKTDEKDYIRTPYGNIPPYSRQLMDYQEGQALRINHQKNRFESFFLFPKGEARPSNFFINPLYIQDMHFGVMFLGLESGIDSSVYEGVRLGLSSSLRNLDLMQELGEANGKLENLLVNLKDSNSRLMAQSHHDSMTSLLNRRGFIHQVKQRMDTCSINNIPYTVFFADMDGLKRINDTFGHTQGDEAILAMADILKKVFRREDLIARFGGDEFAIFSERTSSALIDIIRKRLDKNLNEYNVSSGKSYTLKISIGSSGIQNNNMETLDGLLQKADKALYEQKKLRKQNL